MSIKEGEDIRKTFHQVPATIKEVNAYPSNVSVFMFTDSNGEAATFRMQDSSDMPATARKRFERNKKK